MKVNLMLARDATSGKGREYSYGVRNNTMYFFRRPGRDSVPAGQLEVRQRFRHAAAYAKWAKADPEMGAFYEGLAASRKVGLHALIMTDYLKAPVVETIDVSAFTGAAGGKIAVKASDDCGVVSVGVELRGPDGGLLEQGPAVYDRETWVYQPTGTYPAGTPVTITATAVDRPGNKGMKTETWS